MKKILISAFACDPKMGSEPYVGWNWLKVVLRVFPEREVVLVTRKMHVGPVRDELSHSENLRLDIVGFDIPLFRSLDHRHWFMKPYYVLWQLWIFIPLLLRAIILRDIALAHHSTYNVVDMPGLLWALPGVKFVWGPIGGGQIPPSWSSPLYGDRWPRELRRIRNKRLIKFNPLVRLAVKVANTVLVANHDTIGVLPYHPGKEFILELETGVNDLQAKSPRDYQRQRRFRLLWVGQIEPRKGLELLIRAVKCLQNRESMLFEGLEVIVIGDGIDRTESMEFAKSIGVFESFQFRGAVPFQVVKREFETADVFIFTSVQDTSGNVVLEALSSALPCIAINHQGAGEILSKGGGLLIDPKGFDDAITLIADAIEFAYDNPDVLSRLSAEGLENVRKNYLWSRKDNLLKEIYDEILD